MNVFSKVNNSINTLNVPSITQGGQMTSQGFSRQLQIVFDGLTQPHPIRLKCFPKPHHNFQQLSATSPQTKSYRLRIHVGKERCWKIRTYSLNYKNVTPAIMKSKKSIATIFRRPVIQINRLR